MPQPEDSVDSQATQQDPDSEAVSNQSAGGLSSDVEAIYTDAVSSNNLENKASNPVDLQNESPLNSSIQNNIPQLRVDFAENLGETPKVAYGENPPTAANDKIQTAENEKPKVADNKVATTTNDKVSTQGNSFLNLHNQDLTTPDSSKKLFRISEAANKLGVSASTLRRWGREHNVQTMRTLGGDRRYSEEQIERLMKIKSEEIAVKGAARAQTSLLLKSASTNLSIRPLSPNLPWYQKINWQAITTLGVLTLLLVILLGLGFSPSARDRTFESVGDYFKGYSDNIIRNLFPALADKMGLNRSNPTTDDRQMWEYTQNGEVAPKHDVVVPQDLALIFESQDSLQGPDRKPLVQDIWINDSNRAGEVLKGALIIQDGYYVPLRLDNLGEAQDFLVMQESGRGVVYFQKGGSLYLAGNLGVNAIIARGDLNVAGNEYIRGNSTLSGGLAVSGSATIGSTITFGGRLIPTAEMVLGSNLYATSILSKDWGIDEYGNLSGVGSLLMDGRFEQTGSFEFTVGTGQATFGGKVDVQNGLDISGGSLVLGENIFAVSQDGKITIGREASDSLDVYAASIFHAPVTFGDDIVAQGDVTIGQAGVTSNLTVYASSEFVSPVTFDNSVSFVIPPMITGTLSETFTLDTDDTGGNLALVFGKTNNERLTWNATEQRFELSNDLYLSDTLQGAGGTLTLGAGTNTIVNTDTDTAILINPNGTGAVQFHSAANNIDSSGNLTLAGDVTLTSGGTFFSTGNGNLVFQAQGTGKATFEDDVSGATYYVDLIDGSQALYAINGIQAVKLADGTYAVDATGDIRLSGDLTVTGDKITFADGETIDLETANLFKITTNGNTRVVLGDSGGANQFEIYSSGNIPQALIDSQGRATFLGTLRVGSLTKLVYNAFGTNTTTHGLSSVADVFISGSLEVDNQAYFDANVDFAQGVDILGDVSVNTNQFIIDADGDMTIAPASEVVNLTASVFPSTTSTHALGDAAHTFSAIYTDLLVAAETDIAGTRQATFTIGSNKDSLTTDLTLRFAGTNPETFSWNHAANRFDLSKGLSLGGDLRLVGDRQIAATGSLTLNSVTGLSLVAGTNFELTATNNFTQTFGVSNTFALKQGTSDRIAIDAAGAVNLTSGNNQNIALIPAGNGRVVFFSPAYNIDSQGFLTVAKVISPEMEYAGNITLDPLNAAGKSKVTIENSDGSQVADLEVEGDVVINGSKLQIKDTAASIDIYDSGNDTALTIENSDGTRVANVILADGNLTLAEGDLALTEGNLTVSDGTTSLSLSDISADDTLVVSRINATAGGYALYVSQGEALLSGTVFFGSLNTYIDSLGNFTFGSTLTPTADMTVGSVAYVATIRGSSINLTSGGTVTLTGNLIPAADSTYDLGTNLIRFANIYTDNLVATETDISGTKQATFTIGSNKNAATTDLTLAFGGTNTEILRWDYDLLGGGDGALAVSDDIAPLLGGAYDLGSALLKWRNLYVDERAYLDSAQIGTTAYALIDTVGNITFVNGSTGAIVTGPAGGALLVQAGTSQALNFTGNASSTFQTTAGSLSLTSADVLNLTSTGLFDLNAGANLDIDVTGTFDMLSSGAFSIDGTGTSNVSATSGNLTLSTITSGDLLLTSANTLNLTSAGLLDVNAGANLDIDVTGTFDMLSTGAFSIDGTGAGNVSATSGNLTLSTITSGDLLLTSAGSITASAAGSIFLQPSDDTSHYLTVSTLSDIPTLFGTGAYIRIGDAATASVTGADATALVDSEDDLLVSGNLEVAGSFLTPYAQTIVVAKSGGDFTTIAAALTYAATLTPSATNQILLDVKPGVYTETAGVTMQSYVDIISSGGPETTTIKRTGSTVVTANNVVGSQLSGFTVELDTADAATDYGIDITGNSTVNVTRNHFTQSGTASSAVHVAGTASPTLESNTTLDTDFAYGVNQDSTGTVSLRYNYFRTTNIDIDIAAGATLETYFDSYQKLNNAATSIVRDLSHTLEYTDNTGTDLTGKVAYINATNEVAKADGDDASKMPALGMVVKDNGTKVLVKTQGVYYDNGVYADFTPGAQYYVDTTAGSLTTTKPAGINAVSQVVALGKAENELYLLGLGEGVNLAGTTTPYAGVVTVAKSGGDYTLISSALADISAEAGNRYLIRVFPGVYTDSFTLEDYVDIIAIGGPEVTTIEQSIGTIVSGASNARLEGFTLRKTADSANPIVNLSSSSPVLENLVLRGGGTASQVGIAVSTGSPSLKRLTISNVATGLSQTGTGSAKLEHSSITAGIADVNADGGTLTLSYNRLLGNAINVNVGTNTTVNSQFNDLNFAATVNFVIVDDPTSIVNSYKDSYTKISKGTNGVFNQRDYYRFDNLTTLAVEQAGTGGAISASSATVSGAVVNLQGNSLNGGDLIYGAVQNANDANFLRFQSGAALVDKLIVDTAGNLSASGVFQAGSVTHTTYSRLGTGTTNHGLSGAEDLLISSDLEVQGNLYAGGAADYMQVGTAGDITFYGSAKTITGPGATGLTITNTSGQIQITTVTGGELDLTSAGLFDLNAGANLDIDVTGTFDVLSSSTFSIDGTGASNVSATSGNLTLSTITSGDLLLNSAVAADLSAASNITLKPSGDADDYFTLSTLTNVPTLFGTGAYIRIGDAATASVTGADATALVDSEDDLLVSGNLEVAGSFLTPYAQTITVAKSGGDYTTINAAYTYAKTLTPSATNQILIKVMPGVYEEALTLNTSYISFEGSGRDNTTISYGDGSTNTIYSNSGITGVTLANFRIENTIIGGYALSFTSNNPSVYVHHNTLIDTTSWDGIINNSSNATFEYNIIQGQRISVSTGLFRNNTFQGGAYGLQASGGTFQNNKINNLASTGGTYIGDYILQAAIGGSGATMHFKNNYFSTGVGVNGNATLHFNGDIFDSNITFGGAASTTTIHLSNATINGGVSVYNNDPGNAGILKVSNTTMTGGISALVTINDSSNNYTEYASKQRIYDNSASTALTINQSGAGAGAQIGNGTDYLQVSNVGDLTFVDANDAAYITGPGTGGLTIQNTSGQIQIATLSSGELDLTSAGLMDLNAGANLDIDVTGTFDVLSSSTFSIDGTGASNVSATSGNLTLSTITSGDLLLTSAGNITETYANGGTYTLTDGTTNFVAVNASGAINLTPTAGQNLNINLAGTGDLAVNTNQLYVDTSEGRVGIGTTVPDALLHAAGGDTYLAPDSGYTFNNPSANEDLYVYGNIEVDGTLYTAGQVAAGNILPATDNTYNLGSATYRWANLYLAPASLHISDTTGTSGAGSDYVDGSLLFSGEQLQLKTTLMGAQATGGNILFQSAYPAGGTTTPAIEFKTSTDLATGDQLFRVGDSAANFLTITGGGNVGIGTTSPRGVLDVFNGVSFFGDATYYLQLRVASNIPTIFGSGAYLRIGDAGVASTTGADATALVDFEDDLLVSGNLEVAGSFLTPYAQTITVAKSGGDFTTINAAYNYAKTLTPSTTNRILIKVMPGVYEETINLTYDSSIVLDTSYISIVGIDRNLVEVKRTSYISSNSKIITNNGTITGVTVEGIRFNFAVSGCGCQTIRLSTGASPSGIKFYNNIFTGSTGAIGPHASGAGAHFEGNIIPDNTQGGITGNQYTSIFVSNELGQSGGNGIAQSSGGTYYYNRISEIRQQDSGTFVGNSIATITGGGSGGITGAVTFRNNTINGNVWIEDSSAPTFQGDVISGTISIRGSSATPSFNSVTVNGGSGSNSIDSSSYTPTIVISDAALAGNVDSDIIINNTTHSFIASKSQIDYTGNATALSVKQSGAGAGAQIGNGTDYLQVSNVGDITFVDANDAAYITGPGTGGLTIQNTSGQIQITTVTGGELDLTSAGLMDLNAGANLDIDVTGTFDMLSSSTFSIDGTGASNVSVTSGNLTLSTITSGDLLLSSAGNITETYANGGTYTLTDGITNFMAVNASGAINLTPTAGQNLNINLSGTGDLAVNTNQLYVDTSSGYVGIGTTLPLNKFDVARLFEVTAGGYVGIGTTSPANLLAVNGGNVSITDTTEIDGTGTDGACSITDGIITLDAGSSNSCAGRGTADAVNYNIATSLSFGATTINVGATPTGIATNDEILIINLRGTSSDYSNVGKYETHYVTAVNGNILTLDHPLQNSYDGTTQKIMIQRIPQYTTATIGDSVGGAGSAVLTVGAYNNTNGKGGVIFFRATGAVTVDTDGKVDGDGKGYAGGAGVSSAGGQGGMTYNGQGGNGGTNSNGTSGQGGGGGGGCGSSYTGGTGTTGGAGGGGSRYMGDGANAGYGTVGTGSYNGGASGSGSTGGNGGGLVACDGGGGGGGTYGSANLSQIYFGSGGGGGGSNNDAGGTGGSGGGIVFIWASTITVSGTVSSNGGARGAPVSGATAGGGSGGSIFIKSLTSILGSSLVTATGSTGQGRANIAAGSGRIRLDYTTKTGTTSPAAGSENNFSTPSLLVNRTASVGDIFGLQYAGVDKLRIDNSGNIISATGTKWQPISDSISALNIANSAGTSFVTFDTSNSRVGIGTTAPDSKLHLVGGDTYLAPDSGYTFNNPSANEDLYVYGNLEVDGTAYFGSIGATGDILPTTDNTYNLGSATYRWANLYLAPASLHISDTTGTSGAGTDYVDGSLLFSGEQLQLKTTLMGAQATGGNILFQSAYPSGGTTTPAIELKTSTDLATGDQLFRVGDSAANFLTITGAGNVGIGTTAPAQKLHVEGQCVTGDTLLRRRRRRKGKNGEWIEDWEEVRIDQIQPGDEIQTLDEATGQLVAKKVRALMDMGKKEIFTLTTVAGKTIRTTGNHPYLIAPKAKAPRVAVFVDAANFEISAKSLGLSFDYSSMINAFFTKGGKPNITYYSVDFGTKQQRKFFGYLSSLGIKITTKPVKVIKQAKGQGDKHKANFDVEISFDSALRHENFDTLVLFSGDSDFTYMATELRKLGKKVVVISPWRRTARELRNVADLYISDIRSLFTAYAGNEKGPNKGAAQNRFINGKSILWQIAPFVKGGKWIKVKDLRKGQMIAAVGANGKPVFEEIISITHTKAEQVWDIEVENTHNFVGNDIVAHNTYISGNVGIGTTSPLAKLGVVGTDILNTSFAANIGGLTGTGLVITNAGNVGIGTTNPVQKLHVEGQCITGDTLLPIVSEEKILNSKSEAPNKFEILNPKLQEGLKFTPIKDIQGGEYVLSLNEETGKIEPHQIKGLLEMGVKPVYKLTTEDGREIKTTGNHPYLVKLKVQSAELKAENFMSEEEEFKDAKIVWDETKKPTDSAGLVDLTNLSVGGSDKLKSKITQENAVVNTVTQGVEIRGVEPPRRGLSDPPGKPAIPTPNALSQNDLGNSSWTKVIYLKVGDEIAVVDAKGDTSEVSEDFTSEVGEFGAVQWQKIASIEYVGEEQVYDIEVEGTHNFVGNGIVAHNTYISGKVGIGITAPAAGLHVGTGGTPTYAGANDVYIQNDLEVGGTAYFGSIGATGDILPTTDNTYNLGSATYRWANLYLAPASLHISDTTGTSGAGTDYVDGSLLFSGEQLQLKTTLMGAQATGGNILLQSAYPAGGTTTPAIEFKTSTDLATTDQLFRVGDSAANFLTITGAGNVGIGTTNPVQKLHVEGQCITGDSLLSIVPTDSNAGQGTTGDSLQPINAPSEQATGNGRQATNAPSEQATGNGRQATTIPIKDVKPGTEVYSLNEETGKIEPRKINKLLDMGIKPVFKLTTADGKVIRTTGNHPYLSVKQGGDDDETIYLRRVNSLAESYGVSETSLSSDFEFSQTRTVWSDGSDQTSSSFGELEYSRGQGINAADAAVQSSRFKVQGNLNSGFEPRTTNLEPFAEGEYLGQSVRDGNLSQACQQDELSDGQPDNPSSSGLSQSPSATVGTDSLLKKAIKAPSGQTTADSRQPTEIQEKQAAAETKKSADADSLTVLRTDAVTPELSGSSLSETVGSVNSQGKGVDLGGIEPPQPELTVQVPHQHRSTPNALSQIDLQSARWTKVIYLKVGDEIAVAGKAANSATSEECHPRSAESAEGDPVGDCFAANSPTSEVKSSDTSEVFLGDQVSWQKIASIEYVGEEQVYDIEVEGTHNFIANGILAHNTYLSGNVGIGTTSPGYGLDIKTTTPQLFLGKTGQAGRMLFARSSDGANAGSVGYYTAGGSDNFLVYAEGGSGYLTLGGTTSVRFTTGSVASQTERMRISSTGGLSFGSTYVGTDPGDGNVIISGNVGIGTTAPGYKLTVDRASSGFISTFMHNTGSRIQGLYIGVDANTLPYVTELRSSGDSHGDLALHAGTEGIYIKTSGNVGIGTTSPVQKLHVEGQCVTGDTLLRRRRRRKGKNGEWIEDWENIRIDEIQEGDEIQTLDEETGKLVTSKVKALMDMGRKAIIKLTTASGKTIRTTANHPYLTIKASTASLEKRVIASTVLNSAILALRKDTSSDGRDKQSSFAGRRIAVFIDAANLQKSAQKLGWQVHYRRLQKILNQIGKLTYLGYYTVKPETESQKMFIHSLWRFGYRTVSKPLKIIRDEQGQSIRKANFDVEIAAEAIEKINSYDTLVLFSGDSDFNFIIRKLHQRGKKALVISTRHAVSRELLEEADKFIDLRDMETEIARKSPSFSTGVTSNLATAEKNIPNILPFVKDGRWIKVAALSEGDYIATVGKEGQTQFEKVAKIEHLPAEHVYDIEVEGTHNFVGNDIVAHNTYLSGKVGIGITAPAAGLHVGTGGTPTYAGANDVYIQNDLEVGGTAYFGSIGSTGNILPTTDNTYNLGSATFRWANLYLAPASLHISDTLGTSGAGTDYVDGSLLFSGEQLQLKTTLMGAQATGGNILLQSAYPAGGTTTPALEFKTSTDLATTDQLFRVGDSAANFMTITGGGNVGIGTASPSYKLHVYETADANAIIRADSTSSTKLSSLAIRNASGAAALEIIAAGTAASGTYLSNPLADATLILSSYDSLLAIGTYHNVPLILGTNNAEVMRITNGNVGIGTTAPAQKLHVEGQCVTGDTLLPIVSEEKILNSKSEAPNKFEILNPKSQEGLKFTPIKDIKGGEYVLSLNEETGKIEPHQIKGLLEMGVQPVYKLTTEDGREIKTTGNHPYLVQIQDSESLPLGKTLNPTGETINNLPLSSEDLIERKSSNRVAVTKAASGGRTRINTMPKCFSGGNFKGSEKCLSNVKNTLPSEIARADTSSSERPAGTNLRSKSCFLSDSTTFRGTFSSESNFKRGLVLEDDIAFFFNNPRSIIQSGMDSLFGQLGEVVFNNFFGSDSGSQQIQDLPNHNSGALESGLTVADIGIGNDVLINNKSFHSGSYYTVNQSEVKSFSSTTRWIKVIYLKVGDEIAVAGKAANSPTSEVKSSDTSEVFLGGQVSWQKIASIEYAGEEQVYDIEVSGTHNFVAGHYVNSRTQSVVPSTIEESLIQATDSSQKAEILQRQFGASDDVAFGGIVAHNTYISGNVGIGTTAPAAGLHVGTGGTPSFAGANDVYIQNDLEVGGTAYFGSVGATGSILPTTDNTYNLGSATYRWANLYLAPASLHISDTTGTSGAGTDYVDGSLLFSGEQFQLKTTLMGAQATGGNILLQSAYPAGGTTTPAIELKTSTDLATGDQLFRVGDSAANFLTITGAGNVGIGTTNPVQKLHVEGQCVAGDTVVYVEPPTSDIEPPSKAGFSGQEVQSSKFDVQNTAEVQEKQIKDVKEGDSVYGLNEENNSVEVFKVKALLDMGIQPVFKLKTTDGKEIKTTGNHPYLVIEKEGGDSDDTVAARKVRSLAAGDQVNQASLYSDRDVSQGRAVWLDRSDQPGSSIDSQQYCRGQRDVVDSRLCGVSLSSQRQSLRDSQLSINRQGVELSNRGTDEGGNGDSLYSTEEVSKLDNFTEKSSWKKVIYLEKGDLIAVSQIEPRTSNLEPYVLWAEIESIEYVGKEQVYDGTVDEFNKKN